MRSLVVGYGSIGRRHARLLAEAGHRVGVVSRRPLDGVERHASLEAALDAHRPAYVVVASETARHAEDLELLAARDFRGRVLVEKPLFAGPRALPEHRFERLHVAYNLRFHPLVRRFRDLCAGQRVFGVDASVGQHLSTWRDRDYRAGYSASRERGGGVLRDLSHELDFLCWALGRWEAVVASGGRAGDLEIDSDAAWAMLLRTPRCGIVSLRLDYLHRPGRRTLTVLAERGTYEFDLVHGTVAHDGQAERVDAPIDDTYRAQHAAMLADDDRGLCSAAEAQDVVALIDAIERSAREGTWIGRT